jgi:DNA-binding NtrC family response regulator
MDNSRIVTLDPTGSVGRIVRGALELLDLSPVQIDCPTEASARAEIGRGATLFVIAGDLAGESGMDLASDLAANQRDLPVVVIADEEIEAAEDAPYVLLHRATDAIRIMKAIDAALSAKDVRAALRQTASIPQIAEQDSGGSVPGLDLEHAKRILDQLVVDVGAMSCILATRNGQLLLERGMISSGLER